MARTKSKLTHETSIFDVNRLQNPPKDYKSNSSPVEMLQVLYPGTIRLRKIFQNSFNDKGKSLDRLTLKSKQLHVLLI